MGLTEVNENLRLIGEQEHKGLWFEHSGQLLDDYWEKVLIDQCSGQRRQRKGEFAGLIPAD